MSRFKAIGSSVYEKGDRIGCTPDEAAVELARKLNAYQMRVERLKAEVDQLMIFCNCTLIPNKELQAKVERLTKAGDSMAELMFIDKDYIGSPKQEAVVEWCKATEAKEGKPRA
jgi:hypothetical protein